MLVADSCGYCQEVGFIPEDVNGIFTGELALDGRLRKVRRRACGLLARQLGLPFSYRGNVADVSMVQGVEAYGCSSIGELFCHLEAKNITKAGFHATSS